MKRIFSIAIVLIMLCSLLAVPAFAAGNGSLSMSSASGNRGDTVTLSVNLNSNPGLVTMTIRVSYDTSVLQLTNVSNPGLLVGAQLNTSYGSPYTISWVDGATTTNNTKTGTIATFTFKILDNAKIGDSTVTLQFVDSYDTDYNENSFSATSGKVTVTCKHSYGSWTKVNDTTHKRTCSICQKDETANHSWNGGTVTKSASCKETGVKTYTCTACNATKTETIAKTNDHKYGNWTKANDNTHKHTCSVCSKEETASHSWNGGTVTKAASCKETGVKTYTCTACNATKTETIAKTTNHKYGTWTKVNDTTHKHTCSVCQKEETANHSWNGGSVTKKATCKEAGVKTYTCTACNATKTETIAKTNDHKYGNWTKANDNTHKHTCSVCSKEETASHSWNGGTVTKAASCKETGVKTYTCTACNATKTETIAKTTNHKYGTWTKVNDTTHKHTCSVCQKEETANHSWNGGSVTKKATCKEAGVKTYTCTACNATKTEPIAKLTTHTYDHACDTNCNVCGVTRTTTHNYKTSWSKDKTNHWHECSVCKDKKDVAAHTPGAEATETTAQTCTTCGYVIKAALGHKHNYATTWTTDKAGHWYACSGCAEKSGYAAHDFENACDKDCSICGYTRETEHKFAETWNADANNHWHECTGCGIKQDEAAHEPGAEATATTSQTCTICGYEIAPALGGEETQDPTESTDTITPNTPTGKSDPEDGTFPWWIVIVVAVVAVGGVVTVIVIKKKINSQ